MLGDVCCRSKHVPMLNQELPERLLLTYKPEEIPAPDDDAKPSIDDPNPLPSDEFAPSEVNFEVTPPPHSLDSGDLLVISRF